MAFLMEYDAVVRFVITLILFQLLAIQIRACVCGHPVQSLSIPTAEFFRNRLYINLYNP